ncbi:MAG: hypothetical protein KGJ94_07885 [Xanthomonadaceae bacterium]|nr:hypothetical protein [Xanthomonadaceae bacterium]
MKKMKGGATSQEAMRNGVRAFTGDGRKPAADERETDAELAELVETRQHERRITVTLDEL